MLTKPPERGFFAITHRGRRRRSQSCASSPGVTFDEIEDLGRAVADDRSAEEHIRDETLGARSRDLVAGGATWDLHHPESALGDHAATVADRYALQRMVLSDRTIREELASGRLVIEPFDESLLQPSSVDLRVANAFRVFHNNRRAYIDVRAANDDLTEIVTVAEGEAFILHPGEFVLGSTLERVALPDDLVARLEGKSSLGRLGLLIHSTAGYIDPGFDGTITLELSNVARLPISIYPGMAIGQISYLQMTTPVDKPYQGKYQRQRGPTASAFHREFER